MMAIFYALLNKIEYRYLRFGEFAYILVGILLIFVRNKGKVCLNKASKRYFLCSMSFIVYTLLYFFFEVIYYDDIFKNVLKYLGILSVVFVTSQVFDTPRKYLRFLALFLLTTICLNAIQNGNIFDYRFWHLNNAAFFSLFGFILINLFPQLLSKRTAYYVVNFLIILIILFSKSRTMMVIYPIMLYIDNSKKIGSSGFKRPLLYICIALVSAYLIGVLLDSLSQATKSNIERMELIQFSIRLIASNPLFGIGPGNFQSWLSRSSSFFTYYSGYYSKLTPHNMFLEIVVEWGLIGFVIYIYPHLTILRKLIRSLSLKNNSVAFLPYAWIMLFMFFNVLSGEFRLLYGLIIGGTLAFGILDDTISDTKPTS